MTTVSKKTLVIFGAGSGLGAALARRFGGEGYRVGLVARRASALEARVAELEAQGVEAHAFAADLTDLANLPGLVQNIAAKLGGIDVAAYMPVSPGLTFVPALELTAAKLRPLMDLFAFAPIELAHLLMPLLEARKGAFIYGNGMSSIMTMPGLSGVGPAMSAARNFVLTLNAEAKAHGVYAGAVTIGAFQRCFSVISWIASCAVFFCFSPW